MSAIHIVALGSSSTAGTNLSSPTTERYGALLQTHLRSVRNTHCRVTVLALAGIGVYEQQVTGYSIPGNRSGVVSVNTTYNITAALALKPHMVLYHQSAWNFPEGQANWSLSTYSDFTSFADNEMVPLTQNIRTACINAGVLFRLLGAHPPTAAAKSTNSWSDAQIAGRHYCNDVCATTFGSEFIDYWDDVAVGTNLNDAGHEIAPVYNAGALAASKLLSDGVHMNATYLANTFVPNRLQTSDFATVNDRWTQIDVVP